MYKFNPIYSFRKATLSDVMFFYEAVHSKNEVQINEFIFDQVFKLKLKNKSNQLLVIVDQEDQLAGCAILEQKSSITETEPFFEIELFYIRLKYRKYFAAELLFKEIEKVANIRSIHKIVTSCSLKATINQRFYTKRGFKLVKKTYLKTLV